MEQLKQTSPRSCPNQGTEVATRRSRGAHEDTQSYRSCRRPPAAHEGCTLPQAVHPNLPSAGHSPGSGSSTAAKICAHVQNLFPSPPLSRPWFYRHRWFSGPEPPWMKSSSWAGEWRRSEPEHRTSWPSPAPILSLATAPSSAPGKCFPTGYSPAIHWCASPDLHEGCFAKPSRMSHLKLTPA